MKSDTTHEVSEPVKQYLEQNLEILRNDERRNIIGYLAENETAELEELANELKTNQNNEDLAVRTQLYHADLPKLDETGLVNYNQEEEYVEISELGEEIVEWIEINLE